MIFDVQISEQADRDLRGIYEYIAFELLAPENAAGQLDRLENAISKLDIPNEETRIVTVIRVMYGGRNIDKEIKRHTKYEI